MRNYLHYFFTRLTPYYALGIIFFFIEIVNLFPFAQSANLTNAAFWTLVRILAMFVLLIVHLRAFAHARIKNPKRWAWVVLTVLFTVMIAHGFWLSVQSFLAL